MFTAVKDFLRRRPVPGLATSVLLHVLVVALLILAGLPVTRYTAKRGEPIIVELPELRDSPPPGQPSRPNTSRPAVRERPSTPPTKVARAAPSPDTPRSAVAPKPAPPTPEPPDASRTPAPAPRPTTPDPAAEPAPAPHAAPPPAAASAPAPTAPPAPPQVAAVPPQRGDVVDIRSALRRGAGGSGEARAGITGEPIPLDSSDPRFSEYLEQVRRQIQAKMVYPCVRDPQTGLCEPKTTSLFLHFGILKSGQLQFVEVVKGSPWEIYDDYSMNAIKLASPFPPVPAAIMATLDRGTTGMPITAHFLYTSEVTFRSIAR